MNLSLLLEMAQEAGDGRVAVGGRDGGLSYAELAAAAARGAALVRERGASHLAYLGTNHPALAVSLFSASAASVPFVPLNYRLAPERLGALLRRFERPLVVADADSAATASASGHEVLLREAFLEAVRAFGERRSEGPAAAAPAPGSRDAPGGADPEAVAVVLFTSGTTAEPKAALLRHRHLASYVLDTVELASAADDEAALVAVPPYHVAGVANLLTNLYACRRLVYLERFDPVAWVELVRAERVTHAMVVPTMLARIVEVLETRPGPALPTLRTLAYGGARTPESLLRRALQLLPETGFVHAYGLTETSSTIAVLAPEDHRAALQASDPAVAARLGSVGRPIPGVEVEVRGPDGRALPAGQTGRIWVRGEQVSGEYAELGPALGDEGWFPTDDRGHLDEDGYLYVEGRLDDTIIRGGENVAPAEIEDVLLDHPAVAEAAVVGVPDEEWGQRIAAVVVLRAGAHATEEELRSFVRARLRGSRTPDQVVFAAALPRTDTGKLIRREVLAIVG
jgi:acyl-CoA synthetase (AMP-forming)/AMP-acid ligase II